MYIYHVYDHGPGPGMMEFVDLALLVRAHGRINNYTGICTMVHPDGCSCQCFQKYNLRKLNQDFSLISVFVIRGMDSVPNMAQDDSTSEITYACSISLIDKPFTQETYPSAGASSLIIIDSAICQPHSQ